MASRSKKKSENPEKSHLIERERLNSISKLEDASALAVRVIRISPQLPGPEAHPRHLRIV